MTIADSLPRTLVAFRGRLEALYPVSIRDTVWGVQPPDILPLLALLRHDRSTSWTVRSLARELHLPPAAVQRSLARLSETPVYDAPRRRVSRSAAMDLLEHALPFLVPAHLGGPARGIRTAWAAPVLSGRLAPTDDPPPVWPSPEGDSRGPAVEPLHPAVVALAADDPWMYDLLAIVDGIRLGDARVRGIARELLYERLTQATAV